MQTAMRHTCFLFDNGSLRPEPTLRLREIAAALAQELGIEVQPVSLLHSSGVDPQFLHGRKAELLEPALQAFFAAGDGEAVVLPLFFGPSGALTDYLPARISHLHSKFPHARVFMGEPLVEPNSPDTRIARALLEAIPEAGRCHPLVLVDHGSPVPAVTKVRSQLRLQLRALLGPHAALLGEAAMERRPGPQYAFNDPLLEIALRDPELPAGPLTLVLQFLLPGRHAGPGGDIAEIAGAAVRERPGLEVTMTEPIGRSPLVREVLVERYHEACARGVIPPR